MTFNSYGDKANPSLLLIPGLGVSYEIFLPLIDILKDQFHRKYGFCEKKGIFAIIFG